MEPYNFNKKKLIIENAIINGKIKLHKFRDELDNKNYKSGFILSMIADKTAKNFEGKALCFRTDDKKLFHKDILNNKKELIDFAINNPELSYDILYWFIRDQIISPSDFKDYSEEQISKIPPAILYSIINPDESYKLFIKHGVNSSIFPFMPNDEKKWEALEWIAENEPSELDKLFLQHKNNPFSKLEIFEHYKDSDISKLPKALQPHIKKTYYGMPYSTIDEQTKNLLSKAIDNKMLNPHHYEDKQKDLAYRDYFINTLALDKTSDDFDLVTIANVTYFGEQFRVDILKNKQKIIEFSINNPEQSYNVLYWLIYYSAISPKDLEVYNKEQVGKIPETILHTIQHPDEVYKMYVKHKVYSVIFYCMPKGEKKWEALEWIAENEPSKLEIFFSRKDLSPYKIGELLSHYKDKDIDKLPKALQSYIQNIYKQQNELEQKKEELKAKRDELWLDRNGNLQQFFRINNGAIPIESIDDYVKIINQFVKSGLSASKFCKEYQIDNLEGFRRLCKKYSETNAEFAEYYENNSEQQSKKAFGAINTTINSIAKKKLSLEKFINYGNEDDDFECVLNLKNMIIAGKDNQNLLDFVNKTIEYYYNRLNSYSSLNYNIENLTKALSLSELRFLIPELTSNKNKLNNIQLDVEFKILVTQIEEANLLNQHTKELIYEKNNGILTKLRQYNKSYKPSKFIDTTYEIDGQKITITKDTIASATEFALNHNLVICDNVMDSIIKAIALGSIQNTNEENQAKSRRELKKGILEKIKQCKTLEALFNQVDSTNNLSK